MKICDLPLPVEVSWPTNRRPPEVIRAFSPPSILNLNVEPLPSLSSSTPISRLSEPVIPM